ncbi:SulP family inorganic anion transporter [Sanguibacter sp. Leaf3]|uniref:SulP family inorganic anion transporter n=1 Tax=Sanguibacter sp. Leaf3 TaxID=1736209 RepID=UPI0006F5686C|nr:SulP family inorganic anion transporter [Sanguibacter sp. Leaf3]KQT98294.1 MFS transporter [Sanguibacter sp. Leaf3]
MRGSFRRLLPSLDDYRDLRTSWRADLLAGITVGVVALPLALAFGASSGVGAQAGLVTAIVAGLVAAVFGGSPVQVSGPTGAMVVVLAPIVATHGVGAVAAVSVVAGVLVVLAGVFQLGRTVGFIPWPVIEGFTVGIGVIIALQQVPAAVGSHGGSRSTNAAVAAADAVTGAVWPAALLPVGVALGVITLMLVLHRLAPRAPASFVAIAAATALCTWTGADVQTIGAIPSSLPAPTLPELSGAVALLGPALAVAALAAIESLLSARVATTMSGGPRVDADRELVGQGLASVASGLFGGMPATGAIARTAVNVRAGARTRAAAVVHALALLAIVYLAAQVVSHIPLAALAGVLLATAARMVSPTVVRAVLTSTRADAAVFVVTAVVTVAVDLVVAVLVGLAAAAFFALRNLSRTAAVTRDVLPGPAQPGDERIALVRVDGALFFGASDRLVDEITQLGQVDVVVLRLSHLRLLDATGARALAGLVETIERDGTTVIVKGVRAEHAALLERLDVTASRHPDHLHTDLDAAVAHARGHVVVERPEG